jgi:hypothetical protein
LEDKRGNGLKGNMESISKKIDTYRIKSPTKNYHAEWQVLADEMTEYFGENCYWLFYKKEDWKIRDAFKVCQGKRIRSLRYLMGILNNEQQQNIRKERYNDTL